MDHIRKPSILMFPWLGHGHISPYLELGKKLVDRNVTIYLCSTPANLGSIKEKLGWKYSPSIKLVELRLKPLPDLPPSLHTTNGLPPQLMPTLKEALDMFAPKFANILKHIKPDLLIYDLLQPWAPLVAGDLKIPAVVFIATSATMASFMFHLYFKYPQEFPFSAIKYRDYESAHVTQVLESTANGKKDMDRVIESVDNSSNIVLVKSFKGLEGEYAEYLSSLTKKKIVPAGSLVEDPVLENRDSNPIIEWLDSKDQASTVYVSFGSEYFPSDSDLEEIANGLELSSVNFLWVVRFPKGAEKISAEEKLPKGFLERVGGRGKIVEGWAPQARILGHSNIGGFVSHCGWSSVMESMKFGVPIIAMPMHLDQPINARLVADVGVGVEVVRDVNGGLRRETMAAMVKHVVIDEEGKLVREKAKKMSEDMRMKEGEEIDEVVKELLQLYDHSKRVKKVRRLVAL